MLHSRIKKSQIDSDHKTKTEAAKNDYTNKKTEINERYKQEYINELDKLKSDSKYIKVTKKKKSS